MTWRDCLCIRTQYDYMIVVAQHDLLIFESYLEQNVPEFHKKREDSLRLVEYDYLLMFIFL